MEDEPLQHLSKLEDRRRTNVKFCSFEFDEKFFLNLSFLFFFLPQCALVLYLILLIYVPNWLWQMTHVSSFIYLKTYPIINYLVLGPQGNKHQHTLPNKAKSLIVK